MMQRASNELRRRIAFFLPNMRMGGAERVALTLIKYFVEQGHFVDLLLMHEEGELLARVPSAVRIFDLRAKRIRAALPGLWRYLRHEKPNAIQASMWPLTIVSILAHRLSGSSARLVVSDHAVLSDHYRSLRTRRTIGLTMRLLYPLADARVAVSDGAAQDTAKLSRLPRERFTVIHNPMDFPETIERSKEVEALWGAAQTRILTIGQYKAEKNQALLVRAFARLPKERKARLLVVGEGVLGDELGRTAQAEGVAESVIFRGYALDPWPFYASADLFVLPSREESFGNVLVEALYAGLRVVSTRTVGAAEVLDGGRFGELVEMDDTEGLAAAMTEALADQPDPARSRERALILSGNGSFAAYSELLLGKVPS
jgi:glycosyltransferase involved in cell wall biosynthesis